MEPELLETLATYRTTIGYLGEKDQFGWWQSAFFTQGSDAFLAPLFGRTKVLAQCNGVTQAAARVHDERIGIGHVYHLFRLPEDIEQGIHQTLHDEDVTQRLSRLVADRDAALAALRKDAAAGEPDSLGPVRIGDSAALRETNAWRQAAAAYLFAFEQGESIFPYFADAK